jgi:hypothetical protein
MDLNSRSPVSGDTRQRPLITSLAIISPKARLVHRIEGFDCFVERSWASFSVYAACKINDPPEAQEAVGGGQELSGRAPRADES